MTGLLSIDIARQELRLYQGGQETACLAVSTGRAGSGEERDSGRTPRGWHRVRACIGRGLAPGAVLVGRRPTGEIHTPALAARYPQRDWVLSRILWLCGCEPGFNRLGRVDSQRRFIYIHGTPDEEPMGTPLSHGCIRMRNQDVIWLFERVAPGTRVYIAESLSPTFAHRLAATSLATKRPAVVTSTDIGTVT